MVKKVIHKIKSARNKDEGPKHPPKITNKTIADHREEIIGGARKFIYPLQHSKHKVLTVSIAILIAVVVGFIVYLGLALYRFNQNSEFLYRVTQVLPVPVAKAGNDFIAYENYLFELRHYVHYYESQQNLDFDSVAGADQLDSFKKQALDKVINDAYIKKLAKKYNITVTDQEIEQEIEIVRQQNRLGSSDQVFEDVLKEYWNWSIDDFKRTLRTNLLAQKVVATLDTNTNQRAAEALEELKNGADFAEVAKKYSDDTATRDNGGEFGVVSQTNRDIPAKTTTELFSLESGEFSEVINVGYYLEIVKNLETISPTRAKGARIQFNYEDISTYIEDIKAEQTPKQFITL